MNKKAGVIATSVAIVAVCASLISGATYALFTSESEVDITVSSGKVEVVTTVVDAKLVRPDVIGEEGVTETALTENEGVLTLKNIIPGDTIEFTVVLENKGTVKAKYNYALEADEAGQKLLAAFDVTIGGWEESKTGIVSYTSAVGELEVGATVSYTVKLVLNSDKNNEYKDLSTELTLSSYAVQSNANYSGDEVIEYLA